jgi:hypothetical protein
LISPGWALSFLEPFDGILRTDENLEDAIVFLKVFLLRNKAFAALSDSKMALIR